MRWKKQRLCSVRLCHIDLKEESPDGGTPTIAASGGQHAVFLAYFGRSEKHDLTHSLTHPLSERKKLNNLTQKKVQNEIIITEEAEAATNWKQVSAFLPTGLVNYRLWTLVSL